MVRGGLAGVPQVVSAAHVTGEYDYELRIVAARAAEAGPTGRHGRPAA